MLLHKKAIPLCVVKNEYAGAKKTGTGQADNRPTPTNMKTKKH